MRRVAVLGLLVGCGSPPTPEEALADRTAEGDTDCGTLQLYPPPGRTPETDAARACVLAARADARSFHVLVQGSFVDYGWVENERELWHFYYTAGDELPASDPFIEWTRCADLGDLGADCRMKEQDLCFVCVEPF